MGKEEGADKSKDREAYSERRSIVRQAKEHPYRGILGSWNIMRHYFDKKKFGEMMVTGVIAAADRDLRKGDYYGAVSTLYNAYDALTWRRYSELDKEKFAGAIRKRLERVVEKMKRRGAREEYNAQHPLARPSKLVAYLHIEEIDEQKEEEELKRNKYWHGITRDALSLIKRIDKERGGLEEKSRSAAIPAAAILGFLGAIFFFSTNITGNVIGNMTNSTSNAIGAIFLVIGLVGAFFWMKKRK